MKAIKILSYNKFSGSCKRLKEALLERGVRKVRIIESLKFVDDKDFCICWGSPKLARDFRDLRQGYCVNRGLTSDITNKLYFFESFAYRVPARALEYLPRFVTGKRHLPELFAASHSKDKAVVCRTKLNGHSGEGIVIVTPETPEEDIPECKLYTEYIKKREEFRVHIFADPTNPKFFVQQKLRSTQRLAEGSVDYKVRNLTNGWVYVNVENAVIPEEHLAEFYNVLLQYGISFGALDIVWNKSRDNYYILEVNAAPGIDNDTLAFYADNLYQRYVSDLDADASLTSPD